MNNFRELVQVMPLADIRQIILDWEPNEGSVPGPFLTELCKAEPIGATSDLTVAMAASQFAFEAYRFIAHMYGAAVFREDFLVETDQ